MSTPSLPNTTPEPAPPAPPGGSGMIVYRVAVVCLLGVIAWSLSKPAEPAKPSVGTTLALPGSTWRLEKAFDKKKHVGILDFGMDGSVAERGSGVGKFEIVSPDEITLDPRGLFSWPLDQEVARWGVQMAGDNLVLENKAKSKRVIMRRVRKSDEQHEATMRDKQQASLQETIRWQQRVEQHKELIRALQQIGEKLGKK